MFFTLLPPLEQLASRLPTATPPATPPATFPVFLRKSLREISFFSISNSFFKKTFIYFRGKPLVCPGNAQNKSPGPQKQDPTKEVKTRLELGGALQKNFTLSCLRNTCAA
jgi:hypothetical protein